MSLQACITTTNRPQHMTAMTAISEHTVIVTLDRVPETATKREHRPLNDSPPRMVKQQQDAKSTKLRFC